MWPDILPAAVAAEVVLEGLRGSVGLAISVSMTVPSKSGVNVVVGVVVRVNAPHSTAEPE